MSFILIDKSNDKHDVQINGWNWRPTIALLVKEGILPDEESAERCLCNGCGGYFTKEEAQRAAAFVKTMIAQMKPNERVMSDGRINDKPKDYRLPITEWDEREGWNRYSASYEWLEKFRDFCLASSGFDVH